MDCEAGSEESSVSKDYKKPWIKKKDYESANHWSMADSSGKSFNSEEEDKNALYDIIHNMVDRIIESKQETDYTTNKKQKIDL